MTQPEKDYKKDVANIVFLGQAGAGKSTCADYIRDTYSWDKVSFAKLLKEVAVLVWGDDAFNDRDKLQKLGTFMRSLDEDVWCRPVFKWIDDAPKDKYVNDDCRFPNEYWGMKERGFVIVRVIADEVTRTDRLLRNGKLTDPEQLNHESETALIGLEATKAGIVSDYTVQNDGSIQDAFDQVETIMTNIREQI